MALIGLALPKLAAAQLSVSVSTEGASAVVAFRGEADLFTLPLVVEGLARVIADSDGPVVVELAETTFIDSGTVRAFAGASQFLADRGRKLTLRSPSRLAIRVLTLLELSHLIEAEKATSP